VYYLGFGGFHPSKVKRLSESYQITEFLLAEKEITCSMLDPVVDAVMPDLAGIYGQVEGWWMEQQNEERKAKGKLFGTTMSLTKRKKGKNEGDGI
jgi:hypothetical protein